MYFMCVCAHAPMCASATRPEECVRFHGTRVTGSCEPPCGCWEELGSSGRAASAPLPSHLSKL